jgi:hypothetical protein
MCQKIVDIRFILDDIIQYFVDVFDDFISTAVVAEAAAVALAAFVNRLRLLCAQVQGEQRVELAAMTDSAFLKINFT